MLVKNYYKDKSVAAGVDVSFALVTGFVVVAFLFALFIKEPNRKSQNMREV